MAKSEKDDSDRELHPSEIAKNEAETAKLKAETAAEKLKSEAEAAKFEAETRQIQSEAHAVDLLNSRLSIEVDREQEKRDDELASHRYHHVYLFNGPVDAQTAHRCMDQLTKWDRQSPECDIEIIFNSPGGSITSGLALWDHIQFIKSNGHKVTTSTVGLAASMAGILLQSGDVRIMGAESWLLIHQASFSAMGSFGDVEDTVKWIERIQERIINIFAERSSLTKAQIKRRWSRTDWWIDSDEALSLGLIDKIR